MALKRKERPGEFALIAKYFQPLANNCDGALGLLDDAALFRPPPGFELVLTVDTIAADVHFAADDPAESIARKALRVNLSDLAAKGSVPVGYLLSLALPVDWSEQWISRFSKGLAADQRTYGLSLLGGDTTRASGGLTVTVTAIGLVPKGKMVRRAGAQPGDAIFVSGTIGDAALGLAIRQGSLEVPSESIAARLEQRYLHPQPRIALAPILRRFASSAMDISDGLVGDLAHICEVSGVGAKVAAEAVPLSSAARRLVVGSDKARETVLTGGDDYEILATVNDRKAERFAREAAAVRVPMTRIGIISEKEQGLIVTDRKGDPIAFEALGHTHF